MRRWSLGSGEGESPSPFGWYEGCHFLTFLAMASTACPAAMRVSHDLLVRYARTCSVHACRSVCVCVCVCVGGGGGGGGGVKMQHAI